MVERNKIMNISKVIGNQVLMVNNCWGWLPEALLAIPDFENLLDDLNEYKWQESEKYLNYPIEKMEKPY